MNVHCTYYYLTWPQKNFHLMDKIQILRVVDTKKAAQENRINFEKCFPPRQKELSSNKKLFLSFIVLFDTTWKFSKQTFVFCNLWLTRRLSELLPEKGSNNNQKRKLLTITDIITSIFLDISTDHNKILPFVKSVFHIKILDNKKKSK